MKHLKSILAAFAIASVLLFSCKSKDVEGTSGSCKVTKVASYELAGTSGDSAIYTYTGDKVTKVQLSDGSYYTLQYNGNLVTRRNLYSNASSSTPASFEQVTYNPDNTIQKVEMMDKAATGYTVSYRSDFSYTGGKLNKLTTYLITNTVATKDEEYTYTYSGDNITSVKYDDFGGAPETTTFTFDSNSNYFRKQNSQIYFVDPFAATDGNSLAIILSANNVSSVTVPGIPVPIQVTYQTDDKQNLTIMRINNQPILTYSYNCQ